MAEKVRLSNYVHLAFPHLISRKAGQKALKKEHILLNNKLGYSYDWVDAGDIITFIEAEIKTPKLNFPIEVIFENNHFAIIDKPAGINVSGNRKAISHYLNAILRNSEEVDALPRFTAVHRLDRDTKGLLIIAKTKRAQLGLQQQFIHKKLTKEYHALVIGKPALNSDVLVEEIEGKTAITEYEMVSQTDSCLFGSLTLLRIKILTGRKHQIRIHLSNIGLPIVGDKIYTTHKPIGVGKGMFLFATKINMNDPITNERLTFKIDLPPKVERVLEYYGTNSTTN